MRLTTTPVILLVVARAFAAEPVTHRDLAYVEPASDKQRLDVYSPPGGGSHPIVFWIHGGGWQGGDKTSVATKPQAFVEKGCVFVSINYRLLPAVTINEMAGDVAKAFRWVHDNARRYGGDPNTIFVMGHSAGAQLAALVSIDDRYLKAEGMALKMIKGCVPVDGDSYDVAKQIETVGPTRGSGYRRKFGGDEGMKELSSVMHVARGKDIPPFMILHIADRPESGTKFQSDLLARTLQEANGSAKVVPAAGKTHVTLDSDLGLPGDKPTQAVYDFMDGLMKR